MAKTKRILSFVLTLIILFCMAGITGAENENTPYNVTLLEKVNGKLKKGESVEYEFFVPEDNASISVDFIGYVSKDRTYGAYELSILDSDSQIVFVNRGKIKYDNTSVQTALLKGDYAIRITETGNYSFQYAFSINAKVYNDIPVTRISFDKSKAIMSVGDSLDLKLTYEPFYTTYEAKWSTSNAKIATVKNGKIKVKALGIATITATMGDKKTSCKLIVSKDNRAVTIYQNESRSVLSRFKQIKNYEKAKWSCSNTKVATVDSEGMVSGIKKGTATITAKIGKVEYNCAITVPPVKLNCTLLYMHIGEKFVLKASGASEVSSWSSSRTSVATVSKNGVVRAKSIGKTTITAVIHNKKYKCEVEVEKMAYGTVKGSVSYYYNRYYGYLADTGSKIYVLDENKGEVVGTTIADGDGNYSIQVPTGVYEIVILSGHNKSESTLYNDNQRTYYWETYGIYLISEMMYNTYIVVEENRQIDVSHNFGISDF